MIFFLAQRNPSWNAAPHSQGLWKTGEINGGKDAGIDGTVGEDWKAGARTGGVQESPAAPVPWYEQLTY